jgi:tetratricopeptide (TPR) repeat protein
VTAESLTTSDDVSASEIYPDLRITEQLTTGDAALRRQDEPAVAERLRERTRQSLLEARRELGLEDRRTLTDDARLEPEARTPAQSAADAKDRIATDYRVFPLEAPTPPAAAVLQPEAVQPVESELRPTLAVLTPGEQDGFVPRRIEGAEAELEAVALPPGGVGAEEVSGVDRRDVLRLIRQQLDDLARSVDSGLQAGDLSDSDTLAERQQQIERHTTGSAETLRGSELQGTRRRGGNEILAPTKTSRPFGRVDHGGQTGLLSPERSTLELSRRITSPPGGLDKLSRPDISGEARRIRGAHRSLDSLSQDKFNRHMLAAEDYLRAGKYYKAANSFALASMYEPDSPQALAGRSHALFAAGEYISSSLFLSRALAIDPDYAKVRIDLVALLGGQSRLAGRIGDVEQWFDRSGSGSLQLLLGYVYYRSGRLNEAATAIEAAQAKMPRSPAIPAIRVTIDDAVQR